jgi:hypothetical protein
MRAARGQGTSDLQTLTFAERSLLPRPSIESRSRDSEVAAEGCGIEHEYAKSRGDSARTVRLRHAALSPFAPAGEKGRG